MIKLLHNMYKYKNIYLKIIASFISTVSLVLWFNFPKYNLFVLCLFVLLLYISFHITFEKDKKTIISFLVLSLFYTFCLIVGKNMYGNVINVNFHLLTSLLSVYTVCYIFGLGYLVFIMITILYQSKFIQEKITNPLDCSNKKIFLISFCVIIICWCPFFLTYYPGLLTGDSIAQLNIILGNFHKLSDHHPLIHTFFMAIPYNIGFFISNSKTFAVSCITMTQMIIMALIYAYFITYLKNRKISKTILYIIIGIYAVIPVFGFYSITLWKDILFSGLFLLFVIELAKILEKEKIIFKDLISFIVISILMILFRSNALYLYIFSVPFILFTFRKYFKPVFISICIVLLVYFSIKGPIFQMMGVTKSSSAEYLAIPLQQIGRMAYKEDSFSKKEKKQLSKLMRIEDMKMAYDPIIVDGIKFHPNFDISYFNDHKSEYLLLWMNLVKKHPNTAIEAYLCSTLGYWYPNFNYWSVAKGVDPNDIGLKTYSKTPNLFTSFFEKYKSHDLPIVGMAWSIGLCFWFILYCAVICYLNKSHKYLLLYVPILGLWLTMMVASPVAGEFRYVFAAFTTLPLYWINCHPLEK